ncbi:hypothetical protein AJ79_05621 [Helicocarpus griseus UAMH5409]|uniref:Mid2 domain-containing protein n=1 Tax=Helicocarpus griseus UAMH5409 TaxID=1447875 RepID=A0A2B7XL29_9EURO|nr:hypothetical protein AJ79_05621 [Helicocarpus griseus UAMH5409]
MSAAPPTPTSISSPPDRSDLPPPPPPTTPTRPSESLDLFPPSGTVSSTAAVYTPSGEGSVNPTANPAGAPTTTTSSQTSALTSTQKSNGGMIGGAVAGVLILIIILAALLFFWRRRRKVQGRQPPQFSGDDGMAGMSFADTKESSQKNHLNGPDIASEPWPDRAEVYGSEPVTTKDTPIQYSAYHQSPLSNSSTVTGSPDLRGSSVSSFGSPVMGSTAFTSPSISQDCRPGTGAPLVTLNEESNSSTQIGHIGQRAEMLASVPPREFITTELDDTQNPRRAELPSDPGRNLINIPAALRAGSNAPSNTKQPPPGHVGPQLSVTTPEGIVLGSNLNIDRTRAGTPENHVMSFMSYNGNTPNDQGTATASARR